MGSFENYKNRDPEDCRPQAEKKAKQLSYLYVTLLPALYKWFLHTICGLLFTIIIIIKVSRHDRATAKWQGLLRFLSDVRSTRSLTH